MLKQPNDSTNVPKRMDGVMLNSNGITTTNTVYKDNWFDRIAINYLSRALQDASGSFFFLMYAIFILVLIL